MGNSYSLAEIENNFKRQIFDTEDDIKTKEYQLNQLVQQLYS